MSASRRMTLYLCLLVAWSLGTVFPAKSKSDLCCGKQPDFFSSLALKLSFVFMSFFFF